MDLQNRDAPSAANHLGPSTGTDPKLSGGIKAVEHDLIAGSAPEYGGGEDGRRSEGATDESDMTDTDEDDLMNAEFSSTSPSIDNEDIDFEFVYALHTFNATVEGQANALKGDTMVLLDDSNSYWWLVRIVKDSSIGYLPAEHIETPSERLARLNKHRNMDLASPMLSDTTEPQKTSTGRLHFTRKKKPKNVSFTSPFSTTVEYFDVESSEEEGDGEYLTNDEDEGEQTEKVTEEADEITAVESKPTNDMKPKADNIGPQVGKVSIVTDPRKETTPLDTKIRVASELEKVEKETKPVKNGISIRTGNAAFFPDDSTETKKITLTPQVARDDNDSANSSPIQTTSGPNALRKTSLDKALRADSPPPGKDKDKKKKGGVLGNLFKKRGKAKKDDDSVDDFLHGPEKKSIDSSRSVDIVRDEEERKQREEMEKQALKEKEEKEWQEKVEAQRQQQLQRDLETQQKFEQRQAEVQKQREAAIAAANREIMEAKQQAAIEPVGGSDRPPAERNASDSYYEGAVRPLRLVTERNNSMEDGGSRYATPSNSYTAYSPEKSQPRSSSTPTSQQKIFSTSPPNQKPQKFLVDRERLSESPEEVTYEDAEQPPALIADNSGDEADQSSSPEMVDSTTEVSRNGSTGSSNNSKDNGPTWSDTGLRNFFDDSNTEVADMLVRIHDTSDMPAVTEHPLVTPLFQDARDKLADINTKLDNLFMGFLRSRGRI